MASALSEDEFHRMQLQLLELRTAKYELEAQNKKQERELQAFKEAADHAEKELQKAQKTINKSKKLKEVEILIQENDSLQLKLQSQEEDFRLQNQTLMHELNTLCTANEELEKQVAELRDSTPRPTHQTSDTSALEDDIRRLQAQNAALQKNITGLQSKASTPESDASTGELQPTDSPETQSSNDEDVAELQRRLDELKLSLDTEAEEKKMLKQELTEREERHSNELKNLTEKLERNSEKLKRKQESFLQLQTEKENLFKDSSAKLEEVQASKDRDQKYYTDQISKLQQEIAKYQKLQEDSRSNADQMIKQLQNKMAQMQQQIDAADIVEGQHLKERSAKYETHIKDLKAQVLLLTQSRDDLTAKLEESQKSSALLSDQIMKLQKERDAQVQVAQEANKLAEKRKTNLDELAIRYQKDCDKHREQMLSAENESETKVKQLQQRLEQEQRKLSELEKLRPALEDQQSKVGALEEKAGWLERSLRETEVSLQNTKEENEVKVQELQRDHETEVAALKTTHSKEVEDLTNTFQTEIQSLKSTQSTQTKTIESLEHEVKKLKQELKDGVNEKKVHEKKGQSVLKDLKKQLHAERKRAEKLQERLQEVLSNGSQNRSIEDLFRRSDMNDSWREDQSSVSSWSGMGTQASYATNHSGMSPSPPVSHSSPLSPAVELPPLVSLVDASQQVEGETKDLLNRLAEVQQQKWNLEEKVRHLETSTAAMANDLIEKAKIIEHYVKDSRTDTKQSVTHHIEEKLTLKKVLDIVKSDDQGLRDMNKKLQNMLEETLTKNMHLEKDLETMSQEVVRLSKLVLPLKDNSATSGNNRLPADRTIHLPKPSPECSTNGVAS
ncbi:hypothetical protein DPMN_120476 [Dreissena polymorpha]|uniref:GRIP1-associated protein 1 n=2 Tax=Dreissena polymorpha TaxID=45954 RepID=A0A9D4JNK6_DREPO|nr:hypothetical protein DPMN_120476 [Dreissena polymorpha]